MAGHMGNEKVTVKNELISFDAQNGIVVVKRLRFLVTMVQLGKIRIVK